MKVVLGLFALLQTCATPFNYAPTYIQPTVSYVTAVHDKVIVKETIAPIAVPVIVPAVVFQYLPALQPQAVPVAAAPQVPQAPQPDMEAIIADRVEKAIRARLKATTSDSGPPPLILPAELASPISEPRETDEQASVRILSNNCASCHTAGVKTSGNVTLFTKRDGKMYYQPSVENATILAAISPPEPTMPPAAKLDPRSPAAIKGRDYEVLKRWLGK